MSNVDSVMERINRVFQIVFSNKDLTVNEGMTPDEVDGWDSLQHINLLSMLEDEFNIQFDIEQIVSMENVGDIAKSIRDLI